MKRFSKILAAVLAIAMLFAVSGCSNFGKIQKAYEKNDYTLNEDVEQFAADLYAAAMDEETLAEMDIKIYFHVFVKNGSFFNFAVVLEFDCSKEKMQEYMEDEDVKNAFIEAQENDYINGSCVFLFGDDAALEVFMNA